MQILPCPELSIRRRVPYFGPKMIFIPPPFKKFYFSSSRDTSCLFYYRVLFALIIPYLAFVLTFYFSFPLFFFFLSTFLSPFYLSAPFFLFLWQLPPFSLPLSYFFPQITSADIFLGYFPIYRPLLCEVLKVDRIFKPGFEHLQWDGTSNQERSTGLREKINRMKWTKGKISRRDHKSEFWKKCHERVAYKTIKLFSPNKTSFSQPKFTTYFWPQWRNVNIW